MAKQAGRPTKGSEPSGTIPLRVYADVGEMAQWVMRVDNLKSAELLDPILRTTIEAMFAARLHLIRPLKEAEDAFAVSVGRQPGPPLPTVVMADPETTRPKKKEK
jgi:hypothetical protein